MGESEAESYLTRYRWAELTDRLLYTRQREWGMLPRTPGNREIYGVAAGTSRQTLRVTTHEGHDTPYVVPVSWAGRLQVTDV